MRDNRQLVSGIFSTQRDVESVMDALHARGLTDQDVSVLMSEHTQARYPGLRTTEGSKIPEGMSTGGIAGGLLGALIGGLAVTGTVLLPGVGLLVAGPLLGALTGIGIGAAAGGLAGALIGAGIPEEKARVYEESLKQEGNIVIIAHVPPTQSRDVEMLFERYGAQHLQVR
jgi:hypothetical protein